MRRAIFLLCSALLAAGQASAMRAHEFLDEQRGPVTLASDHLTLSINAEPPLDTAAVITPDSDAQLAARVGAGRAGAARQPRTGTVRLGDAGLRGADAVVDAAQAGRLRLRHPQLS